jgi:hypothetical protein
MTELDEILEPRADRLRRQPPYPLVLSGTLVVRPEGRFVRTETAALIGPARGGEAASAGEYVSAIVPPDGQPVIVFPAAGAGGGDINVDATASAVTLPPGSAATVAVTEPVENLFDFDFGIPVLKVRPVLKVQREIPARPGRKVRQQQSQWTLGIRSARPVNRLTKTALPAMWHFGKTRSDTFSCEVERPAAAESCSTSRPGIAARLRC